MRTLIQSNLDVWKEYVEHDFVKQLGQGTLSRERFVHFLKCAVCSLLRDGLLIHIYPCRQDYLYLKDYARANGYGCHELKLSCAEISDLFPCSLLAAKSAVYVDFAVAAETIFAIVKERGMHVSFCAQWGVDLAELESTPESLACTAYGAYIMDVGLQGAFRDPLPLPELRSKLKFLFMCVKEMRGAF